MLDDPTTDEAMAKRSTADGCADETIGEPNVSGLERWLAGRR
jgi:hypothetical protein